MQGNEQIVINTFIFLKSEKCSNAGQLSRIKPQIRN